MPSMISKNHRRGELKESFIIKALKFVLFRFGSIERTTENRKANRFPLFFRTLSPSFCSTRAKALSFASLRVGSCQIKDLKRRLSIVTTKTRRFGLHPGSAFTMAEAVLVMTILGIIATIMITTLKPAEFKDKALKVMADKVLSEIDNATTQILLNDSRDGTMENLIAIDGTNFGVGNTVGGTDIKIKSAYLAGLYKKYLATTRKECSDNSCSCYKRVNGDVNFSLFYLKDGACIALYAAKSNTTPEAFIFPSEDINDIKSILIHRTGKIFFDINGSNEPNTNGKDIFKIPLGKYGIIYDDTTGTTGTSGGDEEDEIDEL